MSSFLILYSLRTKTRNLAALCVFTSPGTSVHATLAGEPVLTWCHWILEPSLHIKTRFGKTSRFTFYSNSQDISTKPWSESSTQTGFRGCQSHPIQYSFPRWVWHCWLGSEELMELTEKENTVTPDIPKHHSFLAWLQINLANTERNTVELKAHFIMKL